MSKNLLHCIALILVALPPTPTLLAQAPTEPIVVKRPPPPPPTGPRPMAAPGGTRAAPTLTGESFSFDLERIEFESVHLNYTQTDRVLGLLKALGYPTIEFVAQQGETDYDAVYAPLIQGDAKLPLVIKMIEATKSSIMDKPPAKPGVPMAPVMQAGGTRFSAVPDIGGTYLHQTTTGEPLQRLLIVYDPADPASLDKLLRLLREEVDVPSRQIVIEALVIQVDSDRMRDLGISFDWSNDESSASFGVDGFGTQRPFTFSFDDGLFNSLSQFKADLHALVATGQAEILTNPSVLVLDGRQARIQIGQQIPVVTSTATNTAVSQRVEYFPVGIVLNLRPRLAENDSEVTMQVETIVSSVNPTGGAATSVGDEVFFAPAVDNRQVQSFVRIADNTPLIIGGLIATEESESVRGVPGLSKIPGLGALFRRKTRDRIKQEVIIVLTPHVVPAEEKSFGYAVPKQSDAFDSFGHKLFRNAYRLRNEDIFDLRFLNENPNLQRLRARIAELDPSSDLFDDEIVRSFSDERIPGEDILVRRMLWEVIDERDFARYVDPQRIIFFEPDADGGFGVSFLHKHLPLREEALILDFIDENGTSFANLRSERIPSGDFSKELRKGNPLPQQDGPRHSMILLAENTGHSVSPLESLRRVLVLERLLELNPTLDLRLGELYVGRQIVFPSEDDLTQRTHLVDRDTARLFYEVEEYYTAFERVLDQRMKAANDLLENHR